MRRVRSASSLTGGRDQHQDACTGEEGGLQTGVPGGKAGGGEERAVQTAWAGSPDTFPAAHLGERPRAGPGLRRS